MLPQKLHFNRHPYCITFHSWSCSSSRTLLIRWNRLGGTKSTLGFTTSKYIVYLKSSFRSAPGWKTLLNHCFAIFFYYCFSNNKTCYVCNRICYDCNIICYGTLTKILLSTTLRSISYWSQSWLISLNSSISLIPSPKPSITTTTYELFWTNFESFWRTLDSAIKNYIIFTWKKFLSRFILSYLQVGHTLILPQKNLFNSHPYCFIFRSTVAQGQY